MLVPIDEFKTELGQFQKRATRAILIAVAVMCALVLTALGLVLLRDNHYFYDITLLNLGTIVCLVWTPIVIFYAAWRVDRMQLQYPSLKCPHCKTLFMPVIGEIVISTGNCTSCGKHVVQDVNLEPKNSTNDYDESKLIAIDDFRTLAAKHSKRTTIYFYFTIVVSLLLIIGAVGICDYYRSHFDPVLFAFLPAIFFVLICCPFWIYRYRKFQKSFQQNYSALLCPNCNKKPHEDKLIATRNCPDCGCKILREPV
jgi:hypothetical protein